RLPDPGWYGGTRLHPRRGSGDSPSQRPGLPARRRCVHRPQRGLRPWLQRARGAAERRAGRRRAPENRRRAPPARRSPSPRGTRGPRPPGARLEASPGRPGHDRAHRPRLGKALAAGALGVESSPMQWVRPKSLSGLMLFGLGLLALPLLVAIITAALQIRTLATTGQKIVIAGVTSARASQQLFSQIASLERTARLYDVLNDPKILDSYKQEDQALSGTRAKLYGNATAGTRRTLAELANVQADIRTTVLTTALTNGAVETAGLSKQFSTLSSLVDKVAQESNQQIDAEVASLQRQTDQARERLFWYVALLLPLTLIAI